MAHLHAPTEERAPGQHTHLGWALVLISIAQLMVVLDATIANIALPFIGKDLDIDLANLSWIVTGYSLAFGGLLLLGGRLGDLYGRRRIFMIGLVDLRGRLAARRRWPPTRACCSAARGLQGLGAALASPAALALITTTFPAGPARNRAFAVYAAMSGAGAAVGLILGGWLTGTSLDVFGIVHRRLAPDLPDQRPDRPGRRRPGPAPARASPSRTPAMLDIPGALTGTLGLLGVVYGLTRAGQAAHGWGDPWTIAALVAGVALLAAFAVIESRVAHPLLPIRIFQNRTRAAQLRGDDAGPGRDVLDVLLPQPVHPEPGRLLPAAHRLRVPAVLGGHRDRRRPVVEPGQPDRPALHRRHRHAAGGGSPCSASRGSASTTPRATCSRR